MYNEWNFCWYDFLTWRFSLNFFTTFHLLDEFSQKIFNVKTIELWL